MPLHSLLQEIDEIVSQIPVISDEKNYWLIRTQSGDLYDAFRTYGFVAIDHEEITLHRFSELKEKFKSDIDSIQEQLKNDLIPYQAKDKKQSEKERGAAIAAGQIVKFMLEVKKGDIVIIPSHGSKKVSFGEVQSTIVPELSDSQLEKTECFYRKRKNVKWIKDISRDQLDPLLYKGFQAHQAINNWNSYSEYIERTIGNFFITTSGANLVLEVQVNDDINAKELFKMGLNLLDVSDSFFREHNLPLSTNDIDLKIYLNSPGKIQFKAPDKRTIWLVAVIGVLIIGGGLKIKVKNSFELDLSTDGAVKKLIDYQNNAHDREKKDELLKQADSLKILPPSDALKMIKQVSPNKDLPQ